MRKVWIKMHKQWAHHYVVRAEHQDRHYTENSLWGRNLIQSQPELVKGTDNLRSAKEAFGHNEISASELRRARLDLKRVVKSIHHFGNDDRTLLGEWMQDMVVPVYTNNVAGAVYIGAGLLVVIVGLRGLGDLSTWSLPSWFLNDQSRLREAIVLSALALELLLLVFLGVLQMFTPEDTRRKRSETVSLEEAALMLKELKNEFAREGVQTVDQLVEKRVRREIDRIKNLL
ncbi:MAG: hypothetical protein KIT50_04540 [Bacteroidetes bacterium]|nr:hypothetical protein [Bacteroidota bacterium]